MRDHPALSILIVSYNTRAMTLACLASVLAETKTTDYEIIVVDNASTDGSAEAIAAFAASEPRIQVLALAENVGFAAGNNRAAELATGRQLLLLNPDTLVIDAGIDKLVSAARSVPNAGIWGGKTIVADGGVDGSCVWRQMTLWGVFCQVGGLAELMPNSPIFNAEAYGGWRRDSTRFVDIIAGCFLLIDRDLWDRLHGFDRLFFMYGEEADLCLRAAAHGAQPYFTPEAVIIHYGGASEATRVGKVEKLLKGKVTLMHQHWTPLACRLGKSMLALWPLTRWQAHRLADYLRPGRGHAEQAQAWRAIWLGRRRWLPGYRLPTYAAAENAPVCQAANA